MFIHFGKPPHHKGKKPVLLFPLVKNSTCDRSVLISHLWGKPAGLWVRDGKEGSLCTNGNSFLSLHNYHVCNGRPPDKAVTFLMPKNTTNQENSALLSFHVDVKFWSYGIVTLALKHKILCSWFLSHNSYTDFIYHVIEILTSYLKFEIQKLLKATLEFGNHLDEHHAQK